MISIVETGLDMLLAFIMVGVAWVLFMTYLVMDDKWKITEKLSNIPVLLIVMGVMAIFITMMVAGAYLGWWEITIDYTSVFPEG